MKKSRLWIGLALVGALAGCKLTATGTIVPGGGLASPGPTISPSATASGAPSASASPAAGASPKASPNASAAPSATASPAAAASPKASPSAAASKAPVATASGVTAFTSTTAEAETTEWVLYKADSFGFQMAVPEGTAIYDETYSDDWGGLYAKYGEAEVFGIGKTGAEESFEDIEAFGVEVTGIPAKFWTAGESGTDTNGWKDYRTATVTDGTDFVLAIYGHGPKGNFLLFLKGPNADLERNRASYEKWVANVKLF